MPAVQISVLQLPKEFLVFGFLKLINLVRVLIVIALSEHRVALKFIIQTADICRFVMSTYVIK